MLTGQSDSDDLSVLTGAARNRPLFGIAACLLLASLAGLPPTAGFIGKYWILLGLVEQEFVSMAIFAMLMAVVGAVYYFALALNLWRPATVFTARCHGFGAHQRRRSSCCFVDCLVAICLVADSWLI